MWVAKIAKMTEKQICSLIVFILADKEVEGAIALHLICQSKVRSPSFTQNPNFKAG